MGKSASAVTKRTEKRRKARRNIADRREEIRWEPSTKSKSKSKSKSKEGERRSGAGRRFEDKVWAKIQSKT